MSSALALPIQAQLVCDRHELDLKAARKRSVPAEDRLYRDLAETATAMFESLISNHPFVDGNKRVAFFATDVFLRSNGWKLTSRRGVRTGS